jgi:hypothetical protein
MHCLANTGDDDVYSKNEAHCIFKKHIQKNTFSDVRNTSNSYSSRVAK